VLRKPNKQQFSAWIEAHHQRLYRHALWMTADSHMAQDLVQETFYQAWKARAQLRDPDRVLPWLLTILDRNVYRAGRVQPVLLSEAFAADSAVGDGVGDVDGDDLIDLARGLQALQPMERQLLLLHALHGLSYRQIGEQLEIPIGTVMSRLNRCRASLRRLMDRPDKPRATSKVVRLADRAKRGQ